MKMIGDSHVSRPHRRPVGAHRAPASEAAPAHGHPRRDSRQVLNGILWIMRTDAPWSEDPDRHPPYQTCRRRFQQWRGADVMDRLLEALARELEGRGEIDLGSASWTVALARPKFILRRPNSPIQNAGSNFNLNLLLGASPHKGAAGWACARCVGRTRFESVEWGL